MKRINFLIIVMIFISLSCAQNPVLTEEDKRTVETEIHQFITEMESYLQSPSPDGYFNCFLHTDEFAAATMGQLMTNSGAVQDTINKHLGMMKSQSIKTIAEKIYVINKEAAVVSTSKITTITFKDDSQVTMPYALTMLLVRKDGIWKIAHYHN